MASSTRVVFSGSTDTINLTFPYLSRTHVSVQVGDDILPSSAYSWITDSQIKLLAGNPPAGTLGLAWRTTPGDPLVEFAPGNLDADDLNTAATQPLYVAEEGAGVALDLAERSWLTSGFGTGGTIQIGSAGQMLLFGAGHTIVPGPTADQIAAAQEYAQQAQYWAGIAALAATFDPANFYTRSQADLQFYSKSQADGRYYTQSQIDGLISGFATSSSVSSSLSLLAPKANPTFTGRVTLPEENVVRAASNTGTADLQFLRANQTLAGRVVWNGQYNTFQISAYSSTGSLTSLLSLYGNGAGMDLNGSAVLTQANLGSYLPNPTTFQVASAIAQFPSQGLATYHLYEAGSSTFARDQVVAASTIGASAGSWRCMSVTASRSLWMRYA